MCGRPARRCACGRRGTLECDWKVPSRKSGTCDRPICSSCTTSPAPEKDLCLEHATSFASWRAERELEECTVCGWQGRAAQLSGGLCPDCGGETQPLSVIYDDPPGAAN